MNRIRALTAEEKRFLARPPLPSEKPRDEHFRLIDSDDGFPLSADPLERAEQIDWLARQEVRS